MRIFDTIKNKSWSGRGLDIKSDSILVLKSANFMQPINIRQGKHNIKIIGKKRTGDGKMFLEIIGGKGESLFKELIQFEGNSLTEKTYTYESNFNFGLSSIKISRENNVYGSLELSRIIVDVEQQEKTLDTGIIKAAHPTEKNIEVRSIGLEKVFKPVRVNYKDIKKIFIPTPENGMFNKIAFIIPYHIYGGAEVYLESIINRIPEQYQITILYLNENILQKKITRPSVVHKVVKSLDQLPGVLRSNYYDFIVYYNRLDIYETLVKMKEDNEMASSLIEIYHSDFTWPGALSLKKERKNIDKVIFVSKLLGHDISGTFLREVVPVGIDLDRFMPKENFQLREKLGIPKYATVLGTVARLSKEKNLNYIISLAKVMKDCYFVIVGDGPEKHNLISAVNNDNIKNVIFAGHVNNPEEYYNIFDGFVLASNMEGTPISIIEAMSSGVPVFSNMVGSIPSLIEDGVTGFKIDSDVEAASNVIKENIGNLEVIGAAMQFVSDNHNAVVNSQKFVNTVFEVQSFFKKQEAERNVVVLKGEYI